MDFLTLVSETKRGLGMNNDLLRDFLALPVSSQDTWQGGVAAVPEMMQMPEGASHPFRIILFRCKRRGLIHGCPLMPDAGDALEPFIETMLEFSAKPAERRFRPSQIDCNDRQLVKRLNELLHGSGTEVCYRAKMGEWNTVIGEMVEHFQSSGPPTLPSLRDAGCSDEQIKQFAAAAAEFYRTKLWELLDDTDLIKIESPHPPQFMKFAVVLGAASQCYGLGLYRDDQDHYALMAQRTDPRQLSLFSFAYESPADVASDDVDLWRELNLPLETGEAFPDANLYAHDESRRPTPPEIDFLTILLRALAQTSEAELDSGRWTQWVQVSGKQIECVLSIPNLVDPPDRAEWIRRGKMPDRREHELDFRRVQEFISKAGENMDLDELNKAISAQFAGRSFDDDELPRNTPDERAAALYQDALESFGRRRVVLARAALAENPAHVDARILIAESTRAVDRRVEMFQEAKQAAAAALGSDQDEFAGKFWLFHETRPFMRACHGLAYSLAEAGQMSDAIEQYREMLRLNPHDNQGVRYELVPLFLEQGCDTEAKQVLDEYPEETALWLYMKALVEFRRSGNSPMAKKGIRAAFGVNGHVPKILQSEEPPLTPDSYVLGSPEEAAVCWHELETVFEETHGFLDWMLQEFLLWDRDRVKKSRERQRKSIKKSKRKH